MAVDIPPRRGMAQKARAFDGRQGAPQAANMRAHAIDGIAPGAAAAFRHPRKPPQPLRHRRHRRAQWQVGEVNRQRSRLGMVPRQQAPARDRQDLTPVPGLQEGQDAIDHGQPAADNDDAVVGVHRPGVGPRSAERTAGVRGGLDMAGGQHRHVADQHLTIVQRRGHAPWRFAQAQAGLADAAQATVRRITRPGASRPAM